LLIGVVQGVTEFLPVSSSGHIALLEHWFGVFSPDLSREVALHLATLLAVLIYFRSKVWKLIVSWLRGRDLNYLLYLVVGSLPAAAVGFLGKDYIEKAFASPTAIGFFFLITSLILLSTRWARGGGENLNIPRSLLIGIAQALAILPGISRSGTTISAGLHLKIPPEEAFGFSFLLSIPAVAGAGLLEAVKVSPASILSHWQGMVVAFAAGYLSLSILGGLVKKGRLWIFSPYLFLLFLLVLIKGG